MDCYSIDHIIQEKSKILRESEASVTDIPLSITVDTKRSIMIFLNHHIITYSKEFLKVADYLDLSNFLVTIIKDIRRYGNTYKEIVIESTGIPDEIFTKYTSKSLIDQEALYHIDPSNYKRWFSLHDKDAILWSIQDGHITRDDVTLTLVKFNNLSFLKWSHSIGFPINSETYIQAAHMGKTDVLQWLHENNCPISLDDLWSECCEFPDQTIQWGFSNSVFDDQKLLACNIASVGRTDLLSWLRDGECDWDESVTEITCDIGWPTTFSWAIDNGCPYDYSKLTCWIEEKMDTYSEHDIMLDCYEQIRNTLWSTQPHDSESEDDS